MLNADDPYTLASVFRLKETVRQHRPIVLWIGAGASRWASLPSWHDLANKMRKRFAKSVATFPDHLAVSHMTTKRYPELFDLCKETDSTLFNDILLEQLGAPTPGPIYDQFIERLKGVSPLQLVTTNVDLCLEQRSGIPDVIERADLERCGECIQNGAPFIAKLHGSISSIGTTIFGAADYQKLVSSGKYIASLRAVFSMASVVFLGYGLQDDYVLNLIRKVEGEHKLFGSGPHFLVTNSPGPPEDGVHRIAYRIIQHPDHRAALTVLNLIEQANTAPVVQTTTVTSSEKLGPSKKESGFYISDFKPSGTHLSGHALELTHPTGKMNALTGLGFVDGELPTSETVAFHDLAVGLVCFDRVFLPLSAVGVLHERATEPVFWPLVDSGAIRFVDVVHHTLLVFQPGELIGDLGVALIQAPDHVGTRSSMSEVRKMLKPVPGRESEGNSKIETLGKFIVEFASSEALGLPQMVRDALLLPRVSELLGFSDFIVSSNIPHWLAYPTLRLAHLVQTGLICDQLGIRACRVPFGGTCLLSAAFNVKPAEQSLYDYASFVMSGAFGSNLSSYLESNPSSLLAIIKFRESAEGEALRREISDRLESNDGAEFSVSVEGGLKRAIPAATLQAARNKFSTLMKASSQNASAAVLWSGTDVDDASLRLWRDRSRQLLLAHAKERQLKSDSPCVCGSGDRLRDCCLRPLR